jgi:hypothetical protein
MKTNSLQYFIKAPLWIALSLLAFAPRLQAFSLLGPYANWMAQSNGYREAVDIGGPVALNEEYRWNVPTVTYGFDKSFVDYFGSNGVAAVESAIQILNDLPAASDIVVSNFPTDTRHVNFVAQAQNVYDLKSVALALLVEHMGLGQPVRNILDVPALLPTDPLPCSNGICQVDIFQAAIERNFDPQTLIPSLSVNGTAYSGLFITNSGAIDTVEFPVDPLSPAYSAVADAFSYWYSGLQPGNFYSGLTSDDAGGIAYLLNATNVNWEKIPNDVLFVGSHRAANKKLRGAWRPGVEKINFVPQPQNKRGKFKTAVFNYTASYVTNGVAIEQPVKRVVSQPDILFSAAETFPSDPNSPMFLRTGTETWINNGDAQNGSPDAAGPGVITSPVKITFDKLGTQVSSGGPFTPAVVINGGWASFDESSNPPISYPQNSGQTNLAVRLNYYLASGNTFTNSNNTLFNVPVAMGSPATLQISTNNAEWISLATVTNTGAIVHWAYYGQPTHISFRVVPGAP